VDQGAKFAVPNSGDSCRNVFFVGYVTDYCFGINPIGFQGRAGDFKG
jgi:hypothetical protein